MKRDRVILFGGGKPVTEEFLRNNPSFVVICAPRREALMDTSRQEDLVASPKEAAALTSEHLSMWERALRAMRES